MGPSGAGLGGPGPGHQHSSGVDGTGAAAAMQLNPEERAQRAALEKSEAEKRLQEAEQRLRAAIDELYNKHHKRTKRYSALFEARHPLCPHGDSCIANTVGSLCQSFLLAYGVRVGIGVLLRAFKLMRNKSFHSVLDLQLLLSEKNLIVREEACRNGFLFGGFSGIYHAVRCLLRRCRDRDRPAHAFIAGAISGLSILALDDASKRRSLALYVLARAGQCFFNSSSAEWLLGPAVAHRWRHGGTLLFCLASAQIMYAFVMRPETLPPSYLDFIVKTGPIPAPVLEAVRRSCRGLPVNALPLSAYLRGRSAIPGSAAAGSAAEPLGLGPHPPLIPCSLMHPDTASCAGNDLVVMRNTFRKTFPLYLSLTLVPFVVLNLQTFMQSPVRTAWMATRSAVRSTCFLSLFVGIYQAVVCVHRNTARKDNKLIYWLGGALAGLSALVEKPSRRAELALYTLPRAADSLWYILVKRHLLPDVKYAEVALFCLCLGGLVYYHEKEPHTLAPFVRGILTRFLNRTGFPGAKPSASSTLPTPLTTPTASSETAAEAAAAAAVQEAASAAAAPSLAIHASSAAASRETLNGQHLREEETVFLQHERESDKEDRGRGGLTGWLKGSAQKGRDRPSGSEKDGGGRSGAEEGDGVDFKATAERLEAAFQGL